MLQQSDLNRFMNSIILERELKQIKVVQMSVLRRLILLTSFFAVVACTAEEAKTEPTKDKVTQVQEKQADVIFDEAKLKARFEKMGVTVNKVVAASIPGLIEVDTNGGLFFTNLAGDQFIAGSLYSLDDDGQYVNLIEERQAPLNAEKIKQFEDKMIIYPADNEKYVITIFTDITCGYCVKLHNQMAGYNELGITVRYLAYPRQGYSGEVAEEMARIWCSSDPAMAMDKAKKGLKTTEEADNLESCKTSISEQYMLGRTLGVSGTPAIYLPNGKLVAGYMPPAQLLTRIRKELGE